MEPANHRTAAAALVDIDEGEEKERMDGPSVFQESRLRHKRLTFCLCCPLCIFEVLLQRPVSGLLFLLYLFQVFRSFCE